MDSRVAEAINGGVYEGSAMANGPEHASNAPTEQQSGKTSRTSSDPAIHCEAYSKVTIKFLNVLNGSA
jgi:tartrate dehydratase alpha subunit/fumarate hydratase class I-like protein